jgi:integrase
MCPTMPTSVLIGARAALKSVPDAAEARGVQILCRADISRVVDAAYALDEQLGHLVLVLAATGTRVSQAVRITVADVECHAGRILVPSSAKGRSDKPRKPAGIPVPPDVIARLQPALIG